MQDSLGDRMKNNYERRARHELIRRMPVIVRVDGRAFHTYTRGMHKPFSQLLMDSMLLAARCVAEEMQGFKLGYVQSDEASFLLTDYDQLTTEAWFGYNQSKVETISASIMTAAFNREMQLRGKRPDAHFDARAFNVPREDVANYFLWRMQDWERNSLSMYCSAFYSPAEMHGRGREEQHEMLHARGNNWTTDLTAQQRNGTIISASGSFNPCVRPRYEEIAAIVDPLINCDKQPPQGDQDGSTDLTAAAETS